LRVEMKVVEVEGENTRWEIEGSSELMSHVANFPTLESCQCLRECCRLVVFYDLTSVHQHNMELPRQPHCEPWHCVHLAAQMRTLVTRLTLYAGTALFVPPWYIVLCLSRAVDVHRSLSTHTAGGCRQTSGLPCVTRAVSSNKRSLFWICFGHDAQTDC